MKLPARRRGDRGLAGRHRDPLRAGEDRPARRASASEALGRGRARASLAPRRRTQVMRRRLQRRGQLVSARSRAKNQIHASLMRCLVGRAPFSDLFGVKGRRWLASRAGGGGARVGDSACARSSSSTPDRGGRAVDLSRRPRERRGEAADDGAGGERDLRGDLHGGGRRDPPLPRPASWSPTSGSIPRSASRARARPPTGGSRSRARSPGATRWSRRAGLRSASRGRCTRSMSGSGPGAATRSRSSPAGKTPPASSGACSPAQRTTPTRNRC